MPTCAKLPISHAVRDLKITVRVTGVQVFRARMWLGVKVMRIGAWIIGCYFEVK